jgi:hypothetical protein
MVYWVEKGKIVTKRNIVIAAISLVLLCGSFAAGRYSSPSTVQYVDKIKTVEVQHETRVVEQKVDLSEIKSLIAQYAKSQQRDVFKKKVTIVDPNGGKTITEETTDKTKTDTQKTVSDHTDTKVVSTGKDSSDSSSSITQERTTTKIVAKDGGSNYGLALQFGINVPHPLTGDGLPNYIPGMPRQTVMGITFDRRIIGPIYGGAWGNSRGDAGVHIRFGF